jgi:hypothetical protein
MMKKSLVATAAVLALVPAWAQDSARMKELEQKLEASLRVIDALNKRVEQLEHKTTVPAGEWGARIETVERSVAQIEAASAAGLQADTGLPIHGFADVGGGLRNKAAEAQSIRGFKVGVFDLYMAPQISPQVKALVEIAFEYGSDGALAVDAERMQLGYVFSDSLTLWGGRFHTPYGYWNTSFHHGAQIQTALSRPRFLDFEDAGGILPAHSVGVWGVGNLHTSVGKLGYDLYVVNGDRINAGVLDYQARGDSDGSVGAGFRASLSLAGTGLTLGVHGLNQGVSGGNADGTASGRVKLAMLGGYATYDNDDWEVMAEYYGFRNKDQGGSGTHASNAWYAQVGYNINDQYTPYVRFERTSLSSADPYFALMDSGKSYRRSVAGLRVSVTPKAALKAEWSRSTEVGTSGTPSSLLLQYAIRF